VTDYTAPKNPPTDMNGNKDSENDAKDMNDILCGLSELDFVKVMHCKSTKEIWDKLQNIHEGDDKVKKATLQNHRRQFESLKMKDEENVSSYLLHVDKIVNTIRGLGEIVAEPIIVLKVLRSLPLRFDAKFFSIEEIKDHDKLTMDELHGILTTYEMRTKKEKLSKKEATFKSLKKIKNKETKIK
jgi:hypothetical protein